MNQKTDSDRIADLESQVSTLRLYVVLMAFCTFMSILSLGGKVEGW